MVASALGGQTALLALPTKSTETLDSFQLPVQLKIAHTAGKRKGTAGGVLGNGMDVIKVAVNGKRQSRRVAISYDGRMLLISSKKENMRSILRKRSKIGESTDAWRRIEIASIDRIVRGQMTRKFTTKPKHGGPLPSIPVREDRISLSIVFRINTTSTNLTVEEEDLTITTDSTNSWGSLDLIIPSHNDYELLIRTLTSLLELNHTYRMSMSRDVLLLQHYWMDFGKSLGQHIHQNEWTTICIDRMSVPVRKAAIASLFKKFCLALNTRVEDGIPLSNAVGLLEHTRKLSLHMEKKVDPCEVIWNILLQHNLQYENMPVYDSDGSDQSTIKVKGTDARKKGTDQETITAAAFLQFLQAQQKNSKITIQQVKDLFERLNSITTASQVADDGKTRKDEPVTSFSRELITKAVFMNYILSDSNDAFDPVRGQLESDDMSQPLCSYWINSSHDTYLCDVPPAVLNSEFDINLDNCHINVKMYATALYRGCRCLDVDVWDGEQTQKDQPVIRLDTVRNSSPPRPQSASSTASGEGKNEPIVFSDLLWLVRSFLISNPDTFPVILCIEAHCNLSNQEKMAEDIKNILEFDEMVYIPKLQKGETLPSPATMRGKVVLKFKIQGGSKSAMFDDYDEDIDINPNNDRNTDGGLETVDSMFSDSSQNAGKSPKELEKEAENNYLEAKAAAKKADDDAFNTKIKANRQKQIAQDMLKKANISTQQAENELRRRLGKNAHNTKALPKKRNARKYKESPKSTWTSFFFGGNDDESMDQSMANSMADLIPGIEDEESIDEDDEDDENVQSSMKARKKSGFMSRMLEWGDSDYSGSDDSEEDSEEDSEDDSDDSDDDPDEEDTQDNAEEMKQKHETASKEKNNRPKNDRMRNNRPLTKGSEKTEESEESDDRSAGWIDSTPEFRQYKHAAKKRMEEEDENHEIQKVEKELHGFKEHKEPEDGIEVEHFFSSTVDHALMGHSEAERKHAKASEIVNVAAEVLKKCKEEFKKANNDLIQAKHDAKVRKHEALAKRQEAENKKISKMKEIQNKRIQELRTQKLKSKSLQGRVELVNQKLAEATHEHQVKNKAAQDLREQIKSRAQACDDLAAKISSARTVAETAVSEAQISEERATEAENVAKAAQEKANSKAAKAQEETKVEEEITNTIVTEEKVCNEVNKNFKAAKQKWQVIMDGLERVKRQIREIERSSEYRFEMKEMQRGNLEEGKMRKQHKMKHDEKYGLEEKLQKIAHDKRVASEKMTEAEKYLADAVRRCNEQRQKTAKANDEADNATILAEQLAETMIEEKEAAKMRKAASKKATATLSSLERQYEETESSLHDLEQRSKRAVKEVQSSDAHLKEVQAEAQKAGVDFNTQMGLEKEQENIVKDTITINYDDEFLNPSEITIPSEHEGIEKFVTKAEKKRRQLRSAEKSYQKASEAHKWTEKELDDARDILKQNEEVYYKAKIEASLMESRLNAEQILFNNAVASFDRYKQLMKAAYETKEKAIESHTILEEKATAYRHSQDYSKKMSTVSPVSSNLSEMTLLNSVKFKYFEKSIVLPFNSMHSFSEGRILQVHDEGDYEVNHILQFNKTHMSRVFPSKHKIFRKDSNNFNPVLAWSLGCQMAGMNQQKCDAYVLVNDGRFRVNGSCGYVLKPESMIERKGGDIRRKSFAMLPRQWNIKILSGYNLPKPRKKALSGSINPRVRVTLYDSKHDSPPVVHVTETLKMNGFNPIWDESYGARFKVKDPNTAMILFSLWDVDDVIDSEDFIAAAAIPVSCMRQGYRSIPLFDANHMRCGSHGHTMLLARIDAK